MNNVLVYLPYIYARIPGKIFKIDIVKETFLRIEDYLSLLGESNFDYQIESNYAQYDYQMSISEISPGTKDKYGTEVQGIYYGFESDRGKDLTKRFNEIDRIELFGQLRILRKKWMISSIFK